MNFFQQFFSNALSSLITTIAQQFHMTPEQQAAVTQQMAQLQEQAKEADQQFEAKLNDIAGQNIRQDSSSVYAFVRDARPAFLWVMTAAIAANLILFPVMHAWRAHDWAVLSFTIPDGYLELFKWGFLGYAGFRSFEKWQQKD